MICWPYFADQQVNSRVVSAGKKIGLDMKDVCDRKIVEKMVNDVMVDPQEEFAISASEMAKVTNRSVSADGSSYATSTKPGIHALLKSSSVVQEDEQWEWS
ncbi:hypothetical protein Goklo_005280 [Gossypium klotzschianum]|uniref:Uncharacterized protein n=1 Tax=Gossypium klotzschianum TaxID=34286 RepID=A0A7J8VRI7_9ROSI|nr:hypothetical protein [Gossypium klotzschianum]